MSDVLTDWHQAKQQLIAVVTRLVADGTLSAAEADAILRQVIATDVTFTITDAVNRAFAGTIFDTAERGYERR